MEMLAHARCACKSARILRAFVRIPQAILPAKSSLYLKIYDAGVIEAECCGSCSRFAGMHLAHAHVCVCGWRSVVAALRRWSADPMRGVSQLPRVCAVRYAQRRPKAGGMPFPPPYAIRRRGARMKRDVSAIRVTEFEEQGARNAEFFLIRRMRKAFRRKWYVAVAISERVGSEPPESHGPT